MEQKERLIELSKLSPVEILNAFRNRYYTDGNSTENGIVANAINDVLPRMIVPPCKVGDTVYYITGVRWKTIVETNIRGIYCGKSGLYFYVGDGFYMRGEEIYLTREEAEKALAGRSRQ